MSAYEGFLTSVYAGKDIFRPTFFELIAQEQLSEVFRPAVRFVIDIWRERALPSFCSVLLDSWESFYTLLLLLLEGYHLRVHGATFAEHFFGLRRQEVAAAQKLLPLEAYERARQRSNAPPLSRFQQMSSLVIVVILPWLSAKCKERWNQQMSIPRSLAIPNDFSSESIFYRFYPMVHALDSLLSLSYRMLYLLEQTDTWSPWLHISGLKLARHFPDPPTPGEEERMGIKDLLKLSGQEHGMKTTKTLRF